MIARPKMSQIEWKTIEIGASKVGNFSPFSCPGSARGDSTALQLESRRVENDRDARIHAWTSPRDPAPRRFHPRYGDRACFVGWIRPSTGGVPAQSEMVARYFALLASGKRKLPEDWLDRLATERTVEDELMSLGSCKTLVHHGPMSILTGVLLRAILTT